MSRVSANFKGYYMSNDGEIYSAKATLGRLTRLAGSNTASGRYYTLNGQSYRHDRLKTMVMQSAHFKQEFVTPIERTPDRLQVTMRVHAESVDAGVAKKGYIIARVQGKALVLGSEPKIHLTIGSVNSEMERLANAHPGVKFVRLKIDGSAVAGGVRWE